MNTITFNVSSLPPMFDQDLVSNANATASKILDQLPPFQPNKTEIYVKQVAPPTPTCISQKTKVDKDERKSVYTTVRWADNTFTTVKVSANDAKDESPYMAFCAALAKKLYGSNAATHRMVDRHLESYLTAQKQQAKRENELKEAEKRKIQHERAVRKIAKRMLMENEAKNLLLGGTTNCTCNCHKKGLE